MRPEHVPQWMDVEPAAGGRLYSWPVLPNNPFLIGFFVLLAVPLVLLGPFLLAADLLDRLDVLESVFDGAAGVWVYGAFLSIFTLATGKFFLVALLGRCRLTLGRTGLDYEVLVLGRRLDGESRRVPAEHLRGLRIKDPAHHGIEVARDGGKPFHLKVPIGAGALSRRELERLRDAWLQDLGGATKVA